MRAVMTATATPPKATASGFRATRKGGKGPLTIHKVPIFVETEKVVGKGEDRQVKQFGADWIGQAVAKAQREAADGYLPPLHVWHHGEGKPAVAAGHFRVTGVEQIQFGGETRSAVMADLVITNPAVEADVMASRFPYRSVEIHKLDVASIDSLALLDDEVPHCRLPMLEVGEVAEAAFRGIEVFRAGDRTAVRFAFEDKTPAKDPKMADQGSPQKDLDGDNAKGDAPPKTDGEADPAAAEGASPGVKAVLQSITDGSISVSDFQALVEAIQAKTGGGSDPSVEVDPNKPAPAPAPSGSMHSDSSEATNMNADPKAAEKMKADSDAAVQMAALQGEVAGLKATVAQQAADTQRKEDVAAAMKRLDGRVLGSTFEAEITAFHKEHGPKAFTAFVASYEKTVPPLGGSDPTKKSASAGKAPAVAMKYQAEGVDAVDRATKFAAEYDLQRGFLRMTQEEYVEIQMARAKAAAEERN